MSDTTVIDGEDDGTVLIDVTDQPELALDDGAPAAAAPAAAPAPKQKPAAAKPAAGAVDEAAAALTRSLATAEAERTAALETAAAERRRADAASQTLTAREQELAGYRETVESQELSIITTGLDTATRDMATAKAELRAAHEAGDFDKVADAQEKLAIAAADRGRLQDAKATFEANLGKKPATTEGRVEAQPAAPSAFEQYVAGFTPAAQAWLRAHPECVPAQVGGNAKKNAAMMKGHYAAIEDGLTPNSAEYFQKIEETAGYRQPVSAAANITLVGGDEGPTAEPAPKPKPQQRAQPAAPVSRDPPAANGQPRTTRSVTLTRDQQEAAKISFPQLSTKDANAMYARNLVELEAEGKLGRLTH